jgi:tyrosinase
MFGENFSPEIVDGIQALENYTDYRYKLEGTPHGAIHSGIGGDMSPATSPNGELSFLPTNPWEMATDEKF